VTILVNIPCDHGVKFDLEEARKVYRELAKPPKTVAERIVGPTDAVAEIRRRWPRLCGPCPKGCGYNGIYYASWEHYTMGDW